jgi:hypothetical protein
MYTDTLMSCTAGQSSFHSARIGRYFWPGNGIILSSSPIISVSPSLLCMWYFPSLIFPVFIFSLRRLYVGYKFVKKTRIVSCEFFQTIPIVILCSKRSQVAEMDFVTMADTK